MAVRNMNGDPSVWEGLYWADLSEEEQGFWETLGWTAQVWDSQKNVPASASKAWDTLNISEQKAAAGLGFTREIWDGFEDQ